MATTHLIKLMFCFKLLLILFCIFVVFKLILMLLQWRKHKVLMLPKLIFVIICLLVGVKGYTTVHSIQSNAQNHEDRIIKAKNATRRLYERKGSEAVAKKAGRHAKTSGTKLWHKSQSKYYSLKGKFLQKHPSFSHTSNHSHENHKQLAQQYQQNERNIQKMRQK